MNIGYNTQKQATYIPLGMYRSLEIDIRRAKYAENANLVLYLIHILFNKVIFKINYNVYHTFSVRS